MRYIFVAVICFISGVIFGEDLHRKPREISKIENPRVEFFKALHMVESSGSLNAPDGKAGEIGPLQITEACWLDSGIDRPFSNCRDLGVAKEVAEAYFERWEPEAYKNNDFEALSRLYNSGPNWEKKKNSTNIYWGKINKVLNERS